MPDAPARTARWIIGGLLGVLALLVAFALFVGQALWAEPSPVGEAGDGMRPDPARTSMASQPTTTVAPTAREAVPADDPSVAVPATGSLRVLVRDTAGAPLAAVGVFVDPLDGRSSVVRAIEGATAADGTVTFEDLPAGAVVVRTDRRIERRATVDPTATGPTVVELVIPNGVTVIGTVVDTDGAVVPFATIWCKELGVHRLSTAVASADANGAFRIADLVANSSTIGATAPGHAASLMARVVGQPGTELEVVLRLRGTGASLRGRVVSEDGSPVADALVRVGGRYGGLEQRIDRDTWLGGWAAVECVTDADGRFAADSLPAEEVELLVHAAGFGPHSEFVALRAGIELQIEIALHRGVRIHGIVVGTADRPIPGARVGVAAFVSWQSIDATTGADGRFQLDGVDPDRVVLSVRAEGYRTWRSEPGLSAGDDHELRVQLVAIGALRGRLVDPDDRPLVGWQVVPIGLGGGARPTDDAGRFEFATLDVETVRLRVSPPQPRAWVELADSIPIGTSTDAEVVVRVPREAMPGATVRGRLLGADGNAVPDAAVRLHRGELAVGSVPVDAETGEFVISDLTAGILELSWTSGDDSVPTARLPEFVLAPFEQRDLGEIRLPKAGALRVRVARSDGVPTEHGMGYVRGAGIHEHGFVQRPGEWTEVALLAGHYEVWSFIANGAMRTVQVDVRAGETTTVDLIVEPGVRRYLYFPWPLPAGLTTATPVRFTLRDSRDRIVDQEDLGPDDLPRNYMPALALGEHRLELIAADGRRFRGSFVVDSLVRSNRPIVIEVTEVR